MASDEVFLMFRDQNQSLFFSFSYADVSHILRLGATASLSLSLSHTHTLSISLSLSHTHFLSFSLSLCLAYIQNENAKSVCEHFLLPGSFHFHSFVPRPEQNIF